MKSSRVQFGAAKCDDLATGKQPAYWNIETLTQLRVNLTTEFVDICDSKLKCVQFFF